jgi:amino acid transporter
MATAIDPPGGVVADIEGRPGDHRLASNALGLPGLLFCIVTGAAPITAMLFNVPVITLGAGSASPATFIIATITLAIFSVGYIEMARRVTTAGGFYSFVSHGFGQVLGMGTAGLIVVCYMIFSASLAGIVGYFANTTISDWFGVDIPAWAIMAASIVLITSFALFHIELTARVLGVFLVAELAGLLVFGVAVVAQGGAHGLSAAPLNPANVFGNSDAKSVFGASAAGIALFGAFWSWVGFEMAPNYAEESREPKRLMASATYASVIGLGVLYTFIAYAFVSGWGLHGSAQAVADQFAGKYSSAFYPLTDRYVGSWLTHAFELLIVTSAFACELAFYNTASRYVFAMAREGLLPRVFARTHPRHRSPYVASIAISVAVSVWVGAFIAYDSSNLAALTELATWSPLLGVLGILATQALVSFAIVAYFLRTARDGFHWLRTGVAPVLGGVIQITACYLLISNRESLAGASGVPFVTAIPYATAAIFAVGVAAALVIRARSAERYTAIGRFVHEDV